MTFLHKSLSAGRKRDVLNKLKLDGGKLNVLLFQDFGKNNSSKVKVHQSYETESAWQHQHYEII